MTTPPRSWTSSPRLEHLSPYQPRNEEKSAALRGASLASAQAPAKPTGLANAYHGTNGAMAAATLASTRSSSPAKNKPPQPVENRGSAGPGDAPLSAAQRSFTKGQVVRGLAKTNSSGSLRVAQDSPNSTGPPSNIAATLAVARFTSQNVSNTLLRPSRSPDRANPRSVDAEDHPDALPATGSVRIAKQHFMQLDQSRGAQSTSAPRGAQMADGDPPANTTSSAPTAALIDTLERNRSSVQLSVNGRPLKSISAAHTIQSPRPIKPPPRSPLTAAILAAQKSMPSKKEREASGPQESQHKPPIHTRGIQQNSSPLPSRHTQYLDSATASLSDHWLAPETPESPLKSPAAITSPGLGIKETPARPASLEAIEKANAPPAKNSNKAPPILETEPDDISSIVSCAPAPDLKTKPAVPPPRKKRSQHTNAKRISPPPLQHVDRAPPVATREMTESIEGDVQTYPANSGTQPLPHGLRAPSPGERWIRAERVTPHLTGETFANAITASSLASSRAPSPSKSSAPPPLPKRHHHLLNKHHLQNSRTPSPTKGMRHTMRKPPSPDVENQSIPVARRKGRSLITKAPNKHHEGNRKRWRDEITDRERKRYEGVWAANKGLYTSTAEEESQSLEPSTRGPWGGEDVSNLVVRDIWSRSRLEAAVLGEVWDLVDRRGIGRLTREEFVIGMWLIDQRLKGRKLPVKISASIWDSVRKLESVKNK
ncbi:MAG: Increased rDNA silencing protein [Geoglossum simile]|nr:MAG: Increased rDNA silencing protein [Geoglossum simile]